MAALNQAFSHQGDIPPRSLNGGLYTGEPFAPNAPWANVPAIPDAGYMIHYNLRSANPPADALYQYPGGGERPGNNTTKMIGVERSEVYNMAVVTGGAIQQHGGLCECVKCRMSKYAYL